MSAVAIVSGGTSGIGRAVAMRLAGEGYDVVAFSDAADQVAVFGAEAPASIDVQCVDVTVPSQVEGLVAGTAERYGRIDALCNAAGVKVAGTLLGTGLGEWQRTFAVNVTGAFLLTRAVLPTMVAQQRGAVVNIGSPSAYGGEAQVAYAASKGALLAFGASLALDHLVDGIRVNTVVPGPTHTAMNRGRSEAFERRLARENVAGRVNDPEDVAAAVAFLLSDAAATISGSVLEVGWLPGQSVRALEPEGGGA